MKSNSLFFFNGIFALTCSPIIAYAFFYRWEIRFINGALRFVDKPAWAFSVNLISFIFLVCSILAIFIYRKESNGRKKSCLFLLVASITGFILFLSFFSAIFALIAGILYLVDFNRLVKKINQEVNCNKTILVFKKSVFQTVSLFSSYPSRFCISDYFNPQYIKVPFSEISLYNSFICSEMYSNPNISI